MDSEGFYQDSFFEDLLLWVFSLGLVLLAICAAVWLNRKLWRNLKGRM
jgi:hypothetical protein